MRLPHVLKGLPCIHQPIQAGILSPHGVVTIVITNQDSTSSGLLPRSRLCTHTQRANRSTQETMHCLQFWTLCMHGFQISDGKTLPIIALLVELEVLKPAFAPAPELVK
jgi:hypothetical protein